MCVASPPERVSRAITQQDTGRIPDVPVIACFLGTLLSDDEYESQL